MSNLIKCEKDKCAFRFVRALLTTFHITRFSNLIRETPKSLKRFVIEIAFCYLGRYGGHQWHGFGSRVLDAREVFPLSTMFLARKAE
jgi:hypothetical protein